ncbi:TPA: hypothetical protein N0F65_000617 [Lagenidium giganteum]|uniref:Uncharacterized protein n=1 Tax=Lagenidium giganteum TaxID=4803 RepID=A0AAV2YIZ5_9STRA|nr:TPA: hypothetical protein N0F65_000617 [Lagenidium giganteum]
MDDADRHLMESPVPTAAWPWTAQTIDTKMNARAGAVDTVQPAKKCRRLTESREDDAYAADIAGGKLSPLVAPCPRRVVSPEFIFPRHAQRSSSAEMNDAMTAQDRCIDSSLAALPLFDPARYFHPIVVDRPDVEATSPPSRASNPVIMDSRFQSMNKLDLATDARHAPVQPFYPRACRRPFPPSV